MRIAGLSIEGSRVRASFISGRMGSVSHLGSDEIALPQGAMERSSAFNGALAKWKDAHSLSGVVVGLDLSYFSEHVVELPVRSKNDIRNALPFEMEKFLPLEPGQYSLDFHITGSSMTSSRSIVLAARKEKINWILNCVLESGLKVLAVRCTALELVNELISAKSLTDGILVCPREEAFDVVGIKDSSPELLKTLKGPDEAGRELVKLRESFGKLLYVAGDAGPALQALSPRALSADSAGLVADSAIRKRSISLDFIPKEFAAPRKDYYPYAVGAVAIISVLIFFLTSALSYYKDLSAVKQINTKIEEIKAASKEFAASKKELESLDGKISFLLEFSSTKNQKIRVLTELSRVLPEDAYLTSVSSDEKGKVEIEGLAKRAAGIIGPLEESPLFKDVEFASPVTVREGMERFSLRMQAES